jgi:hypothetical protein
MRSPTYGLSVIKRKIIKREIMNSVMHISVKLLLILLMICISSIANAEMYRWVDKNGNMQITDDLANVPAEYKHDTSTIKNYRRINNNIPRPINDPSSNTNLEHSENHENAKESQVDNRALEVEIQSNWNSMKSALASENIEAALLYYVDFLRPKYRSEFTAMKSELAKYVAKMGTLRLVEVTGYYAECDLRTLKDGTEYSFQVLFIRESDGVWRIMSY